MKRFSTIALLGLLAPPAQGVIEVTFVEDAPKDRFVISNTSECALEDVSLSIDLAPSAGGLYFDTTATGAGVQVFQPFEVARGDLRLLPRQPGQGGVADGQDALTVRIGRLDAGGRAEFTIDVDDTVAGGALGQTRVAEAEMAGARIWLERAGAPSLEGRFDDSGRATTPSVACTQS